MKEDEIAKQIKMYQEMGKADKSIDVTSLMLKALERPEAHATTNGQRRVAYWVSVGLPPFGLYYAAKYYFSDYEDGKTVGLICLALTVLSLVLYFAIFRNSLSSLSGTEQLRPEDVESLIK